MSFKSFQSDTSISNLSLVKSSVRRAVRKGISEAFPLLEEEGVFDDLLPPKDALFIGKCAAHWQLVVHENAPMFFSCRGGPYLPVLRVLHAYPAMMPTVQVDKGAIPFVLRGANIMCRGLTTPGARMDTPLPEGTMVAIMAEGKEHALAVGKLTMSTDEIREVNKGTGVEMIHFVGDGLWYAERIDG